MFEVALKCRTAKVYSKVKLGKFRCISDMKIIFGPHQIVFQQPKWLHSKLLRESSKVKDPNFQIHVRPDLCVELQNQYSNYKNLLQQLAQKIGDVEQEAEEHK